MPTPSRLACLVLSKIALHFVNLLGDSPASPSTSPISPTFPDVYVKHWAHVKHLIASYARRCNAESHFRSSRRWLSW